jgi:hypothetical protein
MRTSQLLHLPLLTLACYIKYLVAIHCDARHRKLCIMCGLSPVPPKVLPLYENQALVSMSQKVVLDCPIDIGDPPSRIQWMRKDFPVELNDHIYQLENGSLIIEQAGVCSPLILL